MHSSFDIAITGGGLAGLTLSIQMAKLGYAVILFEKEQYPFHKVCGEYISMESWDFLQGLGVQLEALNVSHITELQLSSVNGKLIQEKLPLGGFGISRYLLDDTLAGIARKAGVQVMENCKVTDVKFDNEMFTIEAGGNLYQCRVACGSFGKRSNLDVKWKRPFAVAAKNKLNNYIGIKYHIKTDLPPNQIALHIFENGYCGVSKVEGDRFCLCYLTTAENLRRSNGSIHEMEAQILSKNPHLKKIFAEVEILYDSPLSISQISFGKKSQVEDHILMIGDAAGMITPLCGNGMSMAMHAGKLAGIQVHAFLQGKISREQMEIEYSHQWHRHFARRLKAGRRIQRMFGMESTTNILLATAKSFPSFTRWIIRQTHGKPF